MRPGHVAAPLVDGDDLLDLVGRGEPLRRAARPTPEAAPVTATTGSGARPRAWLGGFALREPADLGNSPGVSSGCLQYVRA